MSIRSALEELLLIVEIHQKCTKNNFAWAEVEYAKDVLAQSEEEPVAWAMLNRQQVYERGWRAGYEARGGE